MGVTPGWFWIPTAQSRAHFISYIMEPESDDNIITWEWVDHILQVHPESAEEARSQMMGGADLSALEPEMRERIMERAARMAEEPQQIPMMRVMSHQNLPVIRVEPANEYRRNRYDRP